MTKLLGFGQFGKVYQGEWKTPELKNKTSIAMKTLKEGAGEGDKMKSSSSRRQPSWDSFPTPMSSSSMEWSLKENQ